MKTMHLSIPGIHCASCAALIKEVSDDFPAIKRVDVNIDTKEVTLEHDDDFTPDTWKTEIEALNPDYHVQSVS